ncbi:MAG: YjbH domain-containing protein [Geobacteraceae bacterium]|nr:YjbH domain-containing protein [Geobacteraceae bacterium]
MKLLTRTSLAAVLLLSAVAGHAAEPVIDPMLSFQGFTGILNTPSAHVNTEGSIHLMYSDQRENIWRTSGYKRQDNYLMSVGLFSFFELGGRLTEAPKQDGRMGIRDLSASIKVTSAPLTQDRPYWPVVAAGIQDVGGGANNLQSRYLVISEDLWRFRLSAGYGFSSERMSGGFGGIEFRAHDWVTLLGEYDTSDTSAGIRLVTPEIWKTPLRLAATFKSTLSHKPGTIDVAVGLTVPLDFRKRAGHTPLDPAAVSPAAGIPAPLAVRPAPAVPAAPAAPASAGTAAPVTTNPAGSAATNTVSAAALENLATLQRRLEEAGFIKVRAGQRHTGELVVEYENTIFNHNELDALGVVAGIVSEDATQDYETVRIVIKRKGIRVAVVSAPLATLRVFMKQAGDVRAFRESFSFTYDTGIADDTYYIPHDEGFPFPNTSLILAPGLTTFVGTEAGVFDYVLSFRPEILSNLWKGGVFQARWDIPLLWSSNFDDGKTFRDSRNDPRMDRAMLFQGVSLAPGLMANLGAGLVLPHTFGMLNEITWSPGEGAHRLRGVQSWARDQDTRRTKDVYLGSYRYFHAPLDLSLEATAGRFWGQDRGFSLELKRFFSDTAVSAYYKNTTTLEGKHWQAAGVQFVFPLTPRKDLKIGPLQIRGTDEWSYAQETTLAIGGQQTNDVLTQALAINPQPTTALYRSYFNRDRLSAGYLSEHLDRLREAWQRYRTKPIEKK